MRSHPHAGFSTSRTARERVLTLMYEAEAREIPLDELLDGLTLPLEPLQAELARGLAYRQEEIDALLSEIALGWTLERLNSVDKAILRLAIYELSQRDEVPTAVILNEAVELAKLYSTSRSGGFVNGVLATAAKRLRPEPAGAEVDLADTQARDNPPPASAASAQNPTWQEEHPS